MGNRHILFLLFGGIVICLLLLYALRGVRLMPPTESTFALVDHPLDTVEHIMVDRGDMRVGLVRQEGRWIMTAPFPAQVDQGAVLRLLDAFESVRVKDAMVLQELNKRELSLGALGLQPALVHVSLEGVGQRMEFLIGKETPTKQEVYVRLNDAAQVLVVPAELAKVIPRTADDIRSRRLFPDDSDLVQSLEIRSPGRPFIKLVKAESGWSFTQPAQGTAAGEKVDALLKTLCTNSVLRFVWPTTSNVMDVVQSEALFKTRLGLYGLDQDMGVQLQVTSSARSAPVNLVFGNSKEGEPGLTYTLLYGNEAIGLVSNAVADIFRLRPADLRDRRLFSETPGQVQRLQVQFGDVRFVLSQTNRQWRLEAPVADVADQTAALDLAVKVLSLCADSIDDDLSGDEIRVNEMQFQPISTVEITFGQGKRVFTVFSNDISNSVYRVKFEHSGTRYYVSATNMPPGLISMVGLLALHDRTLLSLPPASLRRITEKREDGSMTTLEREKVDAPWKTILPAGKAVDGKALDAFLAALVSLKADRIDKLDVNLEDLETYGFRKPWLELNVDVESSDAVRKTVLIGRSPGFGKRYAMVRGMEVLFVLDEATLAALSAPLTEK